MSVFDQRNQVVHGPVVNVTGGIKASRFEWVKVIDNWVLILRPFKAVVLSDGSFDLRKGDTIVLSGKCTSVNIAKAVVDTFLMHEIN
jgi:hypothetical protein